MHGYRETGPSNDVYKDTNWKTIFNAIYLTLPQWPSVKVFSLKGGDDAFWYFFYVIQIFKHPYKNTNSD